MKLFFCIKNMGKRKGKKSSKSRKKTSSKAGKDGSLQKESSRNYSQSKSIITNAHGLPNLQQFSTAAPYIPPQTMQRLISQKMAEEEQKLINLEDSIRVVDAKLHNVQKRNAEKTNELQLKQTNLLIAAMEDYDAKEKRLKMKIQHEHKMNNLRRDRETNLEQLELQRDYDEAVAKAKHAFDLKNNRLEMKKRINEKKRENEKSLAQNKNTFEENEAFAERDHEIEMRNEEYRTKLQRQQNKNKQKKELQEKANLYEESMANEEWQHKKEMAENKNASLQRIAKIKNEKEKEIKNIEDETSINIAEDDKNNAIERAKKSFETKEEIRKKKSQTETQLQILQNTYNSNKAQLDYDEDVKRTTSRLENQARIDAIYRSEQTLREASVATDKINAAEAEKNKAIQLENIRSETESYIRNVRNQGDLNTLVIRNIANINEQQTASNHAEAMILNEHINKLKNISNRLTDDSEIANIKDKIDRLEEMLRHGVEKGVYADFNPATELSTMETLSQYQHNRPMPIKHLVLNTDNIPKPNVYANATTPAVFMEPRFNLDPKLGPRAKRYLLDDLHDIQTSVHNGYLQRQGSLEPNALKTQADWQFNNKLVHKAKNAINDWSTGELSNYEAKIVLDEYSKNILNKQNPESVQGLDAEFQHLNDVMKSIDNKIQQESLIENIPNEINDYLA